MIEEILSTVPTVQPPEEEKTFDRWWIRQTTIGGQRTNQPVRVEMQLQKGRKVDGQWDIAPASPETRQRIVIEDLGAAAEEDAELSTLLDDLVNKLKEIGEGL